MCKYRYLGRRTSLVIVIAIVGASLVCDLPNVQPNLFLLYQWFPIRFITRTPSARKNCSRTPCQGCLGKTRTRRAPCNAKKKSITSYQMLLNFFSHAPLALVIFAHAPPLVPSVNCCLFPQKAPHGAL